jgi:hypothetical protein
LPERREINECQCVFSSKLSMHNVPIPTVSTLSSSRRIRKVVENLSLRMLLDARRVITRPSFELMITPVRTIGVSRAIVSREDIFNQKLSQCLHCMLISVCFQEPAPFRMIWETRNYQANEGHDRNHNAQRYAINTVVRHIKPRI